MNVTKVGTKESRIPCHGKGCSQRDSTEHKGYTGALTVRGTQYFANCAKLMVEIGLQRRSQLLLQFQTGSPIPFLLLTKCVHNEWIWSHISLFGSI